MNKFIYIYAIVFQNPLINLIFKLPLVISNSYQRSQQTKKLQTVRQDAVCRTLHTRIQKHTDLRDKSILIIMPYNIIIQCNVNYLIY